MSEHDTKERSVNEEGEMKMVVLMYLTEDEDVVFDLLAREEVLAFSSADLEGHGQGAAGWFGTVPPFRSRMTFAVMPADRARRLMSTVRQGLGEAHPKHPVRGIQLPVEDAAP